MEREEEDMAKDGIRVVIADDEPITRMDLKELLLAEGYQVVGEAADGFDAVEICKQTRPDLVLMDIMLPCYDGYHWCREIRQVSQVPIIFLSSASDNMNLIMAMNMGGDDFIAKPFDWNVLLAKIQALLRRTYDFGGQTALLEHRDAILNTADAVLTYHGERIDLTKNEYRILQALLEQKGKVVSRETLMERLWATDSFVDENTLTVNVNRLRKKLDKAGLHDFIRTKVGMGYLVE